MQAFGELVFCYDLRYNTGLYTQSFDQSVVLQRVVIVNLKSSRVSGLSWRLSRASSEGERSLVFNNKD